MGGEHRVTSRSDRAGQKHRVEPMVGVLVGGIIAAQEVMDFGVVEDLEFGVGVVKLDEAIEPRVRLKRLGSNGGTGEVTLKGEPKGADTDGGGADEVYAGWFLVGGAQE